MTIQGHYGQHFLKFVSEKKNQREKEEGGREENEGTIILGTVSQQIACLVTLNTSYHASGPCLCTS